jgi:hypothetical protein
MLPLLPSRTTLAQEGATLESEGSAGSMVGCCWVPHPPVQPAISSYEGGGGGRRGEGRNSIAPACLSLLSTSKEGEALRQGVGCFIVAESFNSPVAPSAWGEGAG